MKYKNITRIPLLLFSLIGYISCDQDKIDTNDALSLLALNKKTETIVYSGGYYYDPVREKRQACIWKGRNRIDLPNDPDNTIQASNGSEVTSVYVYEGIVYSGGWYEKGGLISPCYWAGSSIVPLSGDGLHDAEVNSIFVSEGVVYSGGYYNDGDKDIPCYWEDTTLVPLSGDGVHDAYVKSIYISDGVIYTGGYYYTEFIPHSYEDYRKPCYWADDIMTPLPPASGGMVKSIVVSGGVVYTGGESYSFYKPGVSVTRACYWVGMTHIPISPGGAEFYSIFVSGGIMYAVGSTSNYYGDTIAGYWKGSFMTSLGNVAANSIYVSDGFVYTGGYYRTWRGSDIPCYWKGQRRTNLPIPGISDHGWVNSIYIVD